MRIALSIVMLTSLVFADAADELAKRPSPWQIEVGADGALCAHGFGVTPEELDRALRDRAARDLRVVVAAAAETPYRCVAEVVGLCQRHGVTDVELSTAASAHVAPAGAPTTRTAVRIRVERDGEGSLRYVLGSEWTGSSEERLLELLDSLPANTPVPVTVEIEGDDVPYAAASRLLAALADRGYADIRMAGAPVDQRPLRVYISDLAPRWEWRYLRNLLAQTPGIELREHLQSADPDFPQAPWIDHESIEPYAVIVLGDVEVTADLAKGLRAWVEAGGGLVLVAGEQHMPLGLRGTALEEVLPVRLPEEGTSWRHLEAPAPLEFSEEGRELFDGPKTPIPAGKAVWWNGEGAFSYLPLSLAPEGRLLAAIAGHPDHPAFAVRTVGRGQVFVSTLDETWRWRSGDPSAYQSFWKTAIRHVARRANPTPLPLLQGPAPSMFLEEALRVWMQDERNWSRPKSNKKRPLTETLTGRIVLFLDDVAPTEAHEAIAKTGGTVVVVAGEALASSPGRLEAMLGARVAGWREVPEGTEVRIDPQAPLLADSPLLAEMLSEVTVRRALAIEGEVRDVAFDAGGPIIAEVPVGEGRVILIACPLDGKATDLPMRPAFPVLVDVLLRRAAK